LRTLEAGGLCCAHLYHVPFVSEHPALRAGNCECVHLGGLCPEDSLLRCWSSTAVLGPTPVVGILALPSTLSQQAGVLNAVGRRCRRQDYYVGTPISARSRHTLLADAPTWFLFRSFMAGCRRSRGVASHPDLRACCGPGIAACRNPRCSRRPAETRCAHGFGVAADLRPATDAAPQKAALPLLRSGRRTQPNVPANSGVLAPGDTRRRVSLSLRETPAVRVGPLAPSTGGILLA
jgi:hypothetical protein